MKGENITTVAYCGLCCLDCHNGKICDLAGDLRKELQAAKYEKIADGIANLPFGKSFANYKVCFEILGEIEKFRCEKGCRNGGGPPFCKIRACCQEKKIFGCWECSKPEECKNLDFLKPVHGDAHLKNISEIRKKGIDGFMSGKRNW
jgi:hypothetical protein